MGQVKAGESAMDLVVGAESGASAAAMASVPDILGLTHTAVTGVVQLIVLLKRQTGAYRSLPGLLDSAEKKSRRIDASIISLLEFSGVAELKSEFFNRTCSDVQEVERELMAIHREINSSSARSNFLSSTGLAQRLAQANAKLDSLDSSLNTVGMIADIVTTKSKEENSLLRAEVRQLTHVLNRVLSQHSPSHSSETMHKAAGREKNMIFDRACKLHLVNDIFDMEDRAQVFFLLGRSYYTGEHEKGVNFDCAARYLLAAFNGGMKSSAYYLGKLYYNGFGVKKSFAIAFEYFSAGSNYGDADSLTEKGWCKEMGYGTSVDMEAAMKFYTLGADAGSARGIRNVGYHCLHGNACPANWPRAARHFLKARRLGARVNYDLALLYENGIGGLERNLKDVINLLREGYLEGDVMSTFWLARCYFFGLGVKKDIAKTIELYEEMKEMGPYASRLQGYLGLCLVRGIGARQNVRVGLEMIRASQTDGSSISWALLGECYRHGYGVRKNANKAIQYYVFATSCCSGFFGVSDAHAALAEMYDSAEGVPQNKQSAVHHFILAANRMHRQSQWKAATYLELGTGIEAHLHQAFFYYDLAARGGHFAAQRKASQLYMKGFGVQRNRMRSIQLLEQANERGDKQAKRMLRRALVKCFLELRRNTQ